MSNQKCPVCEILSGQLKRHLVEHHGWRYTEESPNDPRPPKESQEG